MQETINSPVVTNEEWGNGMVVASPEDGENTGEWIMYDPEGDEVDLWEIR